MVWTPHFSAKIYDNYNFKTNYRSLEPKNELDAPPSSTKFLKIKKLNQTKVVGTTNGLDSMSFTTILEEHFFVKN